MGFWSDGNEMYEYTVRPVRDEPSLRSSAAGPAVYQATPPPPEPRAPASAEQDTAARALEPLVRNALGTVGYTFQGREECMNKLARALPESAEWRALLLGQNKKRYLLAYELWDHWRHGAYQVALAMLQGRYA